MRHRRSSSRPRERRQIYVETLVRTPGERAVDRLWHLTQDPLLHPRWDLRFTHITPDGAPGASGHQRFRYEIRPPGTLGRRWALRGWGTSVGHRRDDDGHGTSALRFHPDDTLSPLGPGSGYWRYVPTDAGVRFLTGYDYEPGWGRLGAGLDPLVVRPLVGWATAWSFDRLRLWAERGVDPSRSRDAALVLAVARLAGVAGGSLLVGRGVAEAIGRRGDAWSWSAVGAAVAAGTTLVTAAVGVPTPARVPSARRTVRRPPDRRAARAPRSLATLIAPVDPGPSTGPAPAVDRPPPTDHEGAPS